MFSASHRTDRPHGPPAITCVTSRRKTIAAKPGRLRFSSRVLKNTRSCHSEGGFCPRNLLFLGFWRKAGSSLRSERHAGDFFSILLEPDLGDGKEPRHCGQAPTLRILLHLYS